MKLLFCCYRTVVEPSLSPEKSTLVIITIKESFERSPHLDNYFEEDDDLDRLAEIYNKYDLGELTDCVLETERPLEDVKRDLESEPEFTYSPELLAFISKGDPEAINWELPAEDSGLEI